MNPKNPTNPTTFKQQIEDDQKGSLERQERAKVVAEAMTMLCCPADAAGKTVKEIITSWDKIRIIFEGGMQMILSSRIDPYEGSAETMVNYQVTIPDLVSYGLLPKSVGVEFKKACLEDEKDSLTVRLKIIEEYLSNNQSTAGIT